MVFLAGYVLGSARQSWERRHCLGVAHPCATSPCRVHRPIGNKPDTEPSDRHSLHRSAPAPNTSGLDNIVLGASRVAFCDASAEGISKREREVIWELDYPDRHGLHTEYLLHHIILYSGFPIYGRTLGTRNWKHGNIGARAPGSPRIEFPLDIFGQARDAIRVFPGTWEAETEWQFG